MKRRPLIGITFLALLSACATQPMQTGIDPPGFFYGFLHGFISFFSLIGSFFGTFESMSFRTAAVGMILVSGLGLLRSFLPVEKLLLKSV